MVMHPLLLILAAAVAHGVAAAGYSPSIKCTNNAGAVHDYFDKVLPTSKDILFHELMGPKIGADPGAIVPIIPDPAIPAFTTYWLRDGCRVYFTWLNELAVPGPGEDTNLLRAQVDDAVSALIRTQHVVSLAGNVFTGGLEEPVFDIHIGKITNPGFRPGSPAADGPPFRAIILIKYAEWLIEPEQNNGKLRCSSIADAPSKRPNPQTFWNEEEGFMTETTVTDVETGGRSGQGSAPSTIAVLNFDPTLGCDSATFQPCSDRALSTLKVVGDAFAKSFAFTQNLPPDGDQLNPFFGWFLEEKLLGGHAQYFGTLHAAEQLFDALITWDLLGELQVTEVSLKFFRQFDQNIKVGTYRKGSDVYESMADVITNWAEKTVLFVADHTPDDYVPTMAMNKESADPVGPRGTLHCLVSVLSVHDAYHGLIPPSWAHGDRYNLKSSDEAGSWDWKNVWTGIENQFRVDLEAV
ncbi:Six-hairpin glycosidase-like protein [Lactarius tabidus]